MRYIRSFLATLALVSVVSLAHTAFAADAKETGNLVSVSWLEKNLKNPAVLILDASPGRLFAAQHIPGAQNVDIFTYGAQELPVAEMERRLQALGISPGKKVVLYDQGGTFLATRLFYDLYYHGVPAKDLLLLDGGMAKWQEAGLAVTKDPTPAPPKGTIRVTKLKEDIRVRLPEVLLASGDPANHALVEALEPNWHFGELQVFDRPGHIPNGIMAPSADFFNADKTFKSPAEIRKMLDYLGVKPEQKIYTYCGGGVAATVPLFAMRFLLNYPDVKLYKESELGWMADERRLPFWTYDAPYLMRDSAWLQTWNGRMLRMYGMAKVNLVDVRPAAAFNEGHVPFAVNISGETLAQQLGEPAKLGGLLGSAGVEPAFETVIISGGGLTKEAALAFAMFERIGHQKISIFMDPLDQWKQRGIPVTKDPTTIGPKKNPQDMAIPQTTYTVNLRPQPVITDPAATKGAYPKVFIASGKALPAKTPDGKVIHVPYTDLLNADSTPKAAKEIWNTLTKAGVPRYAELVTISDDPGEAAANYYVLKLMGYPDVKLLAN